MRWRRRSSQWQESTGLDERAAGAERSLLLRYAVDSELAESYRALRTNLTLGSSLADSMRVVITSDGRNEGKSLTCANLGIVLAQTGSRVALLDCDLRIPTLHRTFNIEPGSWPARLLDPEPEPADFDGLAEQSAAHVLDNLWVVPAGPKISTPSELLGSTRFVQFLDALGRAFDVVLIDTPPVGVVTDATVVASRVDGALFVIDFERTKRREARRSVSQLEAAGCNVLGAVVNRAPRSAGGELAGPYRRRDRKL